MWNAWTAAAESAAALRAEEELLRLGAALTTAAPPPEDPAPPAVVPWEVENRRKDGKAVRNESEDLLALEMSECWFLSLLVFCLVSDLAGSYTPVLLILQTVYSEKGN